MKHLARRFQKDISFLLFCGISRETRGSQMTKSFGYQSGRNPEAYNMKFYTFFQSILIAFLALSIESVYIEDGAVATALEMLCIAVGAAMLWCKLRLFIGS